MYVKDKVKSLCVIIIRLLFIVIHYKLFRKGGALVCFPFNYRVLSLAKWGAEGIPGGKKALVLASLALGAAGSLADLAVPTPAVTMPSKKFGIPLPPLSIDDNFVVPLVSGFACIKIFNSLGWSQSLELSKYIIF